MPQNPFSTVIEAPKSYEDPAGIGRGIRSLGSSISEAITDRREREELARKRQEELRAAETMRQAALQALDSQGTPLSPGQNMFRQMLQDPEVAGNVLTSRDRFQTFEDMMAAAQPPPPTSEAQKTDELIRVYDLIDEMEADGRPRRAEGLRNRAVALEGVDATTAIKNARFIAPDNPDEQRRLVRMGVENAKRATQTDRQIESYMDRGFSRAEAEDLAYGMVEVSVNSKTGRPVMTNTVTGESKELSPGQAAVVNRQPPGGGQAAVNVPVSAQEGETLWDLAEFATGPESAVGAALAVPAAWLGVDPDRKAIYARQTMRLAGRNLVRSLAVNPRFPIAEQERILKETNLEPKFFDAPDLLRTRMIALRNSLYRDMTQAFEDANDINVDPETRRAQGSNAQMIHNFLLTLGVPGTLELLGQGQEAPEQPEGLPEGTKQVGTLDGKPVYQTPDGRTLVME